MEIDFVQEQLDAYYNTATDAAKWLSVDKVDPEITEQSLALLRTFLHTVPRSLVLNENHKIAIALLAQSLYLHISRIGRWEEILYLWPDVKALIEDLNYPVIMAEISLQLAVMSTNRGQVDDALELYDELTSSPHFSFFTFTQRATMKHHQGVCLLRAGDYNHAKTTLLLCLREDTKLIHTSQKADLKTLSSFSCTPVMFAAPLWEIQAYVWNQLGNIAMFQGNIHETFRCYYQSLEIFIAHGEENNLACVSYQSLGRALLLQRNYAAAIPLLEKGLMIRKLRNEPDGVANNAVNLATAYLECNRLVDAKKLLDEAFRTLHTIGDMRGLGFCHLTYGNYELRLGNRDAAIVQWYEALEIASKTQMTISELQIIVQLVPNLLLTLRISELYRIILRFAYSLRRHTLNPFIIYRLGRPIFYRYLTDVLHFLKRKSTDR